MPLSHRVGSAFCSFGFYSAFSLALFSCVLRPSLKNDSDQIQNQLTPQGLNSSSTKLIQLANGEKIDAAKYVALPESSKPAFDAIDANAKMASVVLAYGSKLTGKFSLTNAEASSLAYYSLDGYQPLADALQGNIQSFKTFEHVLKCAISGLAKLPVIAGNVYHGERNDRSKVAQKYQVNGVYKHVSFMSTSQSIFTALKFTNQNSTDGQTVPTILSILSKSGRRFWEVSVNSGEKEILMQPGTQYRVKSSYFAKAGENNVPVDAYFVRLEEI